MQEKYFNFEKDFNGRWYIVLPEWTGPRSDLEMVLGADYMLDILAQGESTVGTMVSLSEYKGYKYELTYDKPEYGGGWYNLKGEYGIEFPVWLCYVTTFVFGHLPKKIYIG